MAGLARGFELIAHWMQLVFRAAARNDADVMVDLFSVGRLWIGETVDEAGRFKVGIAAVLFADPWRGSRTAMRALEVRFKGRL